MVSPERRHAHAQGHAAESLACWVLRLKGYRILATRYKTPVGEIDIIARKRDMIIFAEVKARQDMAGALQAVTPYMQNRITRAASFFLSKRPECAHCALRFDLFAIRLPFYWRHLDNAWRPPA